MPRKKYSPLKDIFLAAKVQGFALQINTEALEQCLTDSSETELLSELRLTINYAKMIHQKGNSNAN